MEDDQVYYAKNLRVAIPTDGDGSGDGSDDSFGEEFRYTMLLLFALLAVN
jgi:hypothetical protein